MCVGRRIYQMHICYWQTCCNRKRLKCFYVGVALGVVLFQHGMACLVHDLGRGSRMRDNPAAPSR